MMIREPAVAGMFYPREPDRCRADLGECLRRAEQTPVTAIERIEKPLGGAVPHAGWICSGAVAAHVIEEIAKRHRPAVVVVFGAIHVTHGPRATVFPSGAWETPLGLAHVDGRLVERLCGQTNLLEPDAHAHEREHSIEVEVPFLQHLLPDSLIVPIMVPATDRAAALGAAVGRACKNFGVDAVFLASTDLTHYGPNYGFVPHGVGPEGLRWAKEVNDRRMIDLILAMREEDAVREAGSNLNACGSGAVAATLAACKAMGARRATLLEHTTSHEVLTRKGHRDEARDAVGYAGILIE
ncbi:MAG TPA: AmmeMemoRadiSam system protein B [Phycisphaerae bacterium]|nr:AmmeMemoRadiSam system protein B [Phycisphaerae bacterium]